MTEDLRRVARALNEGGVSAVVAPRYPHRELIWVPVEVDGEHRGWMHLLPYEKDIVPVAIYDVDGTDLGLAPVTPDPRESGMPAYVEAVRDARDVARKALRPQRGDVDTGEIMRDPEAVRAFADESYESNALSVARFGTILAWTDGPRYGADAFATDEAAAEAFAEVVRDEERA